MNEYKPVPRRSTRLAALAADDSSDHTSQAREGPIAIGKFQLIMENHKPFEEIEVPRSIPVVETIPYSRWASLGYDHQTSEQFVSLEKNLTSFVRELQMKRPLTEGRGISLSVTSVKHAISASDFEFVLPHNQLLCSHWKAFSTALMNYNCDYHTLFAGFVSVRLDRSVLEILSPAFAVQKLTSLYFSGNDLGSSELLMISDIIAQIPTLEALAICRNRIGGQREEVVVKLSTAIRNHPHLQRLTLASCGIGNNKTLLSCIRNRSLKSIDLGSNGIASEGAYFIAKFLAKAKNRHVATSKIVSFYLFPDVLAKDPIESHGIILYFLFQCVSKVTYSATKTLFSLQVHSS